MFSARLMSAGMAFLATLAAPAAALDGVSVEAGRDGSYEMARFGVQWQWKQRWLATGGRHFGGYWDLSAGSWRADALAGQNDSLDDIGLTPTLRWQADDLQGLYLEAGIGAHYLSRTSLGGRRFSTRFQFGDHIGMGYRFGPQGAWDLSYRFQHLSNADIKRPNDGMNSNQLRLQYWFH
jgi:hypothetical protein